MWPAIVSVRLEARAWPAMCEKLVSGWRPVRGRPLCVKLVPGWPVSYRPLCEKLVPVRGRLDS